jgi:hypothetical protein
MVGEESPKRPEADLGADGLAPRAALVKKMFKKPSFPGHFSPQTSNSEVTDCPSLIRWMASASSGAMLTARTFSPVA